MTPCVSIWGRGAVGSAIPLQGKGCGFKSHRFHQYGSVSGIGNAAGCKPVAFSTVGSSPTWLTIWEDDIRGRCAGLKIQERWFDSTSSHHVEMSERLWLF